MSLVAAALVIWRFLLNKSANTDMDEFLPVFQQTLRKKRHQGRDRAVQGGEGADPEPAVRRRAGGGRPGRPRRCGGAWPTRPNWRSCRGCNFLLAPILAIAKIATMVGLFFTVISMINTFNAIGEEPTRTGKAKDDRGHASKIGLALFATAIGLFTAIPLVFSHVLFKDWIARFETKIKAASQKLITLVTNYKKDPKLLDQVLDLDADEDEDEGASKAGSLPPAPPGGNGGVERPPPGGEWGAAWND